MPIITQWVQRSYYGNMLASLNADITQTKCAAISMVKQHSHFIQGNRILFFRKTIKND